MSRAKLAELTGIHWRTIENIERGWTWPDFASLIALTHELGIDPLAGVDVAVSAVGTSGFERHLEDERVVSVVGVEVVFARRDRIGLRTLVEDLPALDRADVELLLAEAAAEDAGGQVAVGSAAGGHASLHWQRSGGVAPDQAVVEATGLLRRLFDDVVILSAAVQADYVEAHLKAVVDVGRNRAGGLKL